MEWIISGQGSHFKNQLLSQITEELEAIHHFTATYTPWANGTVERVCREVIRVTRALCSEWKLDVKDWPAVIEAVQSILNYASPRRLGKSILPETDVYRAPVEVFAGQPSKRPLLRACPPTLYTEVVSMDEVELTQKLAIKDLQCAIVEMHKEVSSLTDLETKR